MKQLFMLFIAAMCLAACNNESKSPKSVVADSSEKNPVATNKAPVLKETNNSNPISEILAAYLQIKNALAADDASAAATGGNAFVEAIGKTDKSAMTADQLKTFTDIADDAREMAEHIGRSTDKIAHQREHFEMLSQDVYDLAKTFQPSQTLYKDYCPMYNKGKGATWISETKEIQNPYLGKSMPACGEVKEEIK